mgnify:CR=1 FL=1
MLKSVYVYLKINVNAFLQPLRLCKQNKTINQITHSIISSIVLLYIQNLHISQTFPLLF